MLNMTVETTRIIHDTNSKSLPLNEDPSYDDTDQQTEDIKKAGHMINESKGIKGMSSSYIWDCMPKRMSGSVACFWHGIGEWKD